MLLHTVSFWAKIVSEGNLLSVSQLKKIDAAQPVHSAPERKNASKKKVYKSCARVGRFYPQAVHASGKNAVANDNSVSGQTIHTDHLGTPQKMTNADQKVVWDRVAEPFGETFSVTGPATLKLRFPGQFHDTESGLDYNSLRSYNSKIGRYAQSDPRGLFGGINTYGYVEGNPINWIDPYALAANQACVAQCTLLGADVGGQAGSVGGGIVGGAGAALVTEGGATFFGASAGAAVGAAGGAALGGTSGYIIGNTFCPNTGQVLNNEENQSNPPPGSKPIDETPWSGDHKDIKDGILAGPKDNVKIDPNGNVWGQNPDGSWTNHGSAGNYTGSGKPSGRRGKDR